MPKPKPVDLQNILLSRLFNGLLIGSLLVVALFTSSSTYAQAYKWVDANGQVHYGDQPPAKVKAEALHLRETQASDATSMQDSERIQRQRQLVQALEKKRQQKKIAKQVKKHQKTKMLKACKQLKGRIKHSETINRYYRYDENGEAVYYSDQEADQLRQRLKDTYQKKCGTG